MNVSYFNTHRLESEGNFSWNFWVSVGKKIKMLFTSLAWPVLGETIPSVWVPPFSCTQDLGHSFSQYGPPSWWITYIYIYMLFTSWEVRIGRNYARGLEYSWKAVLRPRVWFLPIQAKLGWWITFLFFFLLRLKSFRKSFLHSPTYVCWSRTRSCWWSAQSIIANQKKTVQHEF